MQKYVKYLALSVAASLVTALSLNAQLIAYDGFNYPDGTRLDGSTAGQGNGGFGWGANWSVANAATNTSAGLSYNNGAALPTTSGGAVLGYYPGGTAITADAQRMLPATFGSYGSEVWVSVLMNFQTTSTLTAYRETKLYFLSGASAGGDPLYSNRNGSEQLDFGVPHTYNAGASDTLSIYHGTTYVSSGFATPRNADLSLNTVFMVIRVSLDGTTAGDTADMWINPSLTSPLGAADATWTGTENLDAINAIRLQCGSANASGINQVVGFDELHVGTSFASVTTVPEPMTFALASLGGLMFLALRRKK